MPHDDSAFCDDCHFNVRGSAIVRTITEKDVLNAITQQSQQLVKADPPITPTDW